jgi:hypothetical protein
MDDHLSQLPFSRLKAWAALFLCIFLIWGFVFYAGPWLRDSIPIWKQLTEVAKEKDIDTTAFFYSENKESYQSERYLRETLERKKPRGYYSMVISSSESVAVFLSLHLATS